MVEHEQQEVVRDLHEPGDDQRPAERRVGEQHSREEGRRGRREAPGDVGDARGRGALVGRDDGHDERLARGDVHLREQRPGEQERDRDLAGRRERGEHEHDVGRDVGEGHRSDQPEPPGHPGGEELRTAAEQAGGEEHHTRLRG